MAPPPVLSTMASCNARLCFHCPALAGILLLRKVCDIGVPFFFLSSLGRSRERAL